MEKNSGVLNWVSKFGFWPFFQGCIISFPSYCTRLQFGAMLAILFLRFWSILLIVSFFFPVDDVVNLKLTLPFLSRGFPT